MEILKEMLERVRQSKAVKFWAGLLCGFVVLLIPLGLLDPATFKRGIPLVGSVIGGALVMCAVGLFMVWWTKTNIARKSQQGS